jgi:tripartite-type tricarboxylate transporter receptor subunit TctC
MATTTRRSAAAALAAMGAAACVPLFTRVASAGNTRPTAGSQRIIVPFAAGGTADGLGRLVAEILNESLSAQYTIDNRSGRNGSAGAEIAARAPPDGRTLLLGTLGTAITNHYVYRHLDYDSEASFTSVALIAEVANVLLVHPAFPADTLATFVDFCRRQGLHAVTYASPGAGSSGHLFMEHFQSQAGIRLNHLGYGGRSRMMKDLLAGKVLVAMDNLPTYLTHTRSGAVRALGVTSARRCECAPEVASIAEQGYPGYEATLWWYVAAPAATRLALVKRLSDAIVKGIAAHGAAGKIRAYGASERPANGDVLMQHIAAERARWMPIIRAARLQSQ